MPPLNRFLGAILSLTGPCNLYSRQGGRTYNVPTNADIGSKTGGNAHLSHL